nr:hypothetical protein [Tanacetum cinerariifolium]
DLLFQLLFDELLTPPLSIDPSAPAVIAPIAEVITPEPTESTGLPSLTTVDQDAPLPSKSQTTPKTQPPIIPYDVEKDNHDIEVAHMGNDPVHQIDEGTIGQEACHVKARMVSCRDKCVQWNAFGCNMLTENGPFQMIDRTKVQIRQTLVP